MKRSLMMAGVLLATIILMGCQPKEAAADVSEHKHDAKDIHNTISGELKISKKHIKSDKVTSKVAFTVGKNIFQNAFGSEFDTVDGDAGWYGIFGYEIEFE